jgi:hypothetical protein
MRFKDLHGLRDLRLLPAPGRGRDSPMEAVTRSSEQHVRSGMSLLVFASSGMTSLPLRKARNCSARQMREAYEPGVRRARTASEPSMPRSLSSVHESPPAISRVSSHGSKPLPARSVRKRRARSAPSLRA